MTTVTAASSNAFLDSLSVDKPSSSVADAATTAKEASERFLTLLVTQLQNQDPMNPVDNAQMTSQMAQISTVSGIEKLNLSMQQLNSQTIRSQALQGASLVGKDVLVPGDRMSLDADGQPQAVFELDAAASVSVAVLSPAGRQVDTINLGARTAGRQTVDWTGAVPGEDYSNYRFLVSAKSGGTAIASTSLMRDRVDAVNTSGSALTLELERGGRVDYAKVIALD